MKYNHEAEKAWDAIGVSEKTFRIIQDKALLIFSGEKTSSKATKEFIHLASIDRDHMRCTMYMLTSFSSLYIRKELP